MNVQLVAAFIGLAAWVVLFVYGAVDCCLNPEPYRPEPRPRPRYPKGR